MHNLLHYANDLKFLLDSRSIKYAVYVKLILFLGKSMFAGFDQWKVGSREGKKIPLLSQVLQLRSTEYPDKGQTNRRNSMHMVAFMKNRTDPPKKQLTPVAYISFIF